MKTKLIAFIIIILTFSSCNTAKHYANYRFGGKANRDETIKTDAEFISSNEKQHTNKDTIEIKPVVITSLSTENEIQMTEKIQNEKKSNSTSSENKKENQFEPTKKNSTFHLANVIEKRIQIISKIDSKKPGDNNSFSSLKGEEIGNGETMNTLIYCILGLTLILGAVAAFIAYPAILLYIGYGLLILLGAWLMCEIFFACLDFLFGGMLSKKKVSTIGEKISTFFTKIKVGFKKIFSGNQSGKNGMNYYGGMSVKSYFWIGLGAIALAIIIMAIVGASSLGWEIIMGILAAHLFISAISALLVGFISLFPGMSFKKN